MEKTATHTPEGRYVDPIEVRQIDKFVCDEMGRQIHRYIKGMSGSKEMMLKFESQLAALTIEEKQAAIARYIDLNRKAVSGLDLQIVVARAMANYCDTYAYFCRMLSEKERMTFYVERLKQTYFQFHYVYEEEGKFGLKDAAGRVLLSAQYDFLRTCYVYVDDLLTMPVIAQKDGKLGLVVPDGHDTVAAPFVYDDISLRDEYPYFEARKGRIRGHIDAHGTFVADQPRDEKQKINGK